jgi:competence protein ComEC
VFFIVWLMPVYARIFRPKNKFSKFIVGFIGTSISAQLGTFPITAHYFHQTSLLFLAGNVVMIIASYFMVIGGMFSIVISMAGVFPKFWVELFNFLISVCNDYIAWLSGFDSLIFDKISFRTSDSILLIISFFLLRFLILKFNLKYAVSFIALILIFESQRIYFHQKSISKKEFIVFHQRKNSVIGIRDGEKLDLFMGDLNDSVNFQNYILNAYEIHEEIEETRYFSLSDSVHSTYYKTSNFIWWENLKFLILNQDSGSKLPKTDYILVRENAKINLDSIENPVKIIADGSNYPNHLSEHENAVWRTKEKGAFRIIL